MGDAAAREGVRQVAARWHLPVHTRRGPPAAEECARRGSLRQLPAPPARGPPRAASRRAIEWGRGRIAARSPSNARVRIVVLHEDIRHVGDRPRPLAPHRLVPFPCPPAHLLHKLLHCPNRKPPFWLLSALHAHTNLPHRTDLRWRPPRGHDRPGRARTALIRPGIGRPHPRVGLHTAGRQWTHGHARATHECRGTRARITIDRFRH